MRDWIERLESLVASKTSKRQMTQSEAGLIGARRRWGPPRHARLDHLTPEQREIVLALIDAQEKANRADDR